WRIALIHTVPLGLLFVLWWATLARSSYDLTRQANPTSPSHVFRFIVGGVVSTFRALGQGRGVGLMLGVLLPAGLGAPWRPRARPRHTRQCQGRRRLCRRGRVPSLQKNAAHVAAPGAGTGGASIVRSTDRAAVLLRDNRLASGRRGVGSNTRASPDHARRGCHR